MIERVPRARARSHERARRESIIFTVSRHWPGREAKTRRFSRAWRMKAKTFFEGGRRGGLSGCVAAALRHVGDGRRPCHRRRSTLRRRFFSRGGNAWRDRSTTAATSATFPSATPASSTIPDFILSAQLVGPLRAAPFGSAMSVRVESTRRTPVDCRGAEARRSRPPPAARLALQFLDGAPRARRQLLFAAAAPCPPPFERAPPRKRPAPARRSSPSSPPHVVDRAGAGLRLDAPHALRRWPISEVILNSPMVARAAHVACPPQQLDRVVADLHHPKRGRRIFSPNSATAPSFFASSKPVSVGDACRDFLRRISSFNQILDALFSLRRSSARSAKSRSAADRARPAIPLFAPT